jgi:hypothetical protein
MRYKGKPLLGVVNKLLNQQCFAFTPQANFPSHNLNFQGEGDGIESRLPFKIFPTLINVNN